MRFTSRAVVFTGGLFLSFGFITSMFATRLFHLFFTYGFMLGNTPPFPKNKIRFVRDIQKIRQPFCEKQFLPVVARFRKYIIFDLYIKY